MSGREGIKPLIGFLAGHGFNLLRRSLLKMLDVGDGGALLDGSLLTSKFD